MELVLLSLLGTGSTDTDVMQNTYMSSSHQVTDKDPSEPETLQSLQKLVILGQVKVMAKQRKENFMTNLMPSIRLNIKRRTVLRSLFTFLCE